MPRACSSQQAWMVSMNTVSVLDSIYETELRMLLLLHALDRPATVDYLSALDTLAVNAHTLKVGDTNINGTHRLAAGELNTRTSLAAKALKLLALKGLSQLTIESKACSYRLTEDGVHAANILKSPYATALYEATLEVLERIGRADDEAISAYVAKQSERGVRL